MSTNRTAIFLMGLGMAALAANDAIMRHVGARIPVGEMMVIRGCFFVSLLWLADARFSAQRVHVYHLLHKWCVLRGVTELAATYLFLTSILLVPIALATTLVFLAPIILTGASRFVFKEQVGPWRWFAVTAGFCGVLMVTGAGTGNFDPTLLMPLGAAVLVAMRDGCTRMVAKDIPSNAVSMTTGITVGAGGLLSLPWGWVEPGILDVSLLAMTAIVIAVSYYSYITAVRIGELSLLAPIQYTIILWAALFGWTIWDEVPEPHAFYGGAMIIASGLLILYRERIAQRRHLNTSDEPEG